MRQKILIADDDPTIQKIVARTLGAEFYDIFTASNGDDALALAAQEYPDLVVLDIGMPKKNGWEVLAALRCSARNRMTPVILLTGSGSVSDEVFGLDAGADDFIAKPFVADELRARVNSALRRNKLGVSANPLTKLPGSPSIEEEINRRIHDGIPFAFLYIDINNFKPYNDSYGFAAGDRVIRETADILLESVGEQAGGACFVGHIGGDDFVVITEPGRAAHAAQHIVSQFDRKAPGFYAAADKARGYIEAENRQGLRRRFPLISLSIGIVTSRQRILNHYAKVVQLASEMKAFCKADRGGHLSRFAFDRRQDGEGRGEIHRVSAFGSDVIPGRYFGFRGGVLRLNI